MSATFPQNFGQYILLRKIAMGGMAEIFRAKTLGAEGFEKDIVIKRILPHYTEDEDFVKMFIDEASIAAKLQHANIVQIFDFNVVDGCYYIAMEYVEGKDLKIVMDAASKGGKPLSPAQCVWIIMEIAKGLHHAHIKTYKGQPLNIVHRDISPQNAMISFNGEVKLMDFGIAKAASRSTKTVAGTVKGKCAYMSPEQARGKPLDGRSDLFGLAVVLWEMLTQKRLFLGNSDFVTLSNVLKQEAPAPSSVNPDVPEGLDAILLKALEKDRDQRHDTVEAFARELTKWFYGNVEDLDAVSLRPHMREAFSEDLDKIQEWNKTENAMVAKAQEERSRPQQSAQAPAGDDATVALPAADFDPHSAKTVMDGDLNAEDVKKALAEAQSKVAQEATVALSVQDAVAQTGTGTAAAAGTGSYGQQPQSKNTLFLVMLLIVVAVGGAIAFVFMSGDSTPTNNTANNTSDDNRATTTVVPEVAKLSIKSNPKNAKVTVTYKGKSVDYSTPIKIRPGTKVTIEASAEGYESKRETITMGKTDERLQLALAKKSVEAVASQSVFIQPSISGAVVKVVGDTAALKGAGTSFVGSTNEVAVSAGAWKITGPANTKVKVTVSRKDGKGKPVTKDVMLGGPPVAFDLQIAGEATSASTAVLTIKCTPAGSKVTTTVGTVTSDALQSKVSGLFVGLKGVKITCAAAGYQTATKVVDIATSNATIDIALTKKAGPAKPKGFGKLVVNAVPWAKCTVKGKTKMTKATFKRVPAGRVRVRCAFKGKKKAKTVTVRANSTKSVGFRFK